MQAKRLVVFIMLILAFHFVWPVGGAEAETQSFLNITEISADYIMGSTIENGTLEVYENSQLFGQANAGGNFYLKFNKPITAGTLTIKFNNETLAVLYEPASGQADDNQKILTGNAGPNALVSAYLNDIPLQLKQYNQTSGAFEFYPSAMLTSGSTIKLISEKNGIKNVSSIVVTDKTPPKAPIVNKLTDKVFAIIGSSEAGATIHINRNSRQFAILKADQYGRFYFSMPLQLQGTVFEVYALDSSNNKSLSTKVIVTAQARRASSLINAPVVKQMPQLPRGCEVTSLTMLLNFTGIKVSKMTLAQQVKKDPSPYKIVGGKRYFGNPNFGFVGNMYTFSKPGFGVYNGPIAALAQRYKPNRIVNLSGQSFDAVLNYVSQGHPVWVITTSWFSYVPGGYWQTWYTANGTVRITMKEHSVLITGYNSNYVYFNDPLDGTKNKKKPLKAFVDGWKQFGNQAISYY